MDIPKKIPLVDLAAQYDKIKNEIDTAISRTIARSAFIGGDAVAVFETKFAEFCESSHAVGVGNGTDALELILEARDIGRGDEVIIPSMTFAATAEAVIRAGAVPVFVDSDPGTLNIDARLAREAVTPRTRAVIAVHLYGQPADLDALGELARDHDLLLIEDAAQAHGARWSGRRVGAIGDAASFSFYPGKNLGAYGDAGAVVTNDGEIAARVRLLANHGRTEKYTHVVPGRNSRLDALQASVLNVKLRHADAWNDRRREIARSFDSLLAGKVDVLQQDPRAESVYHLYVVQVPNRQRVREALAKRGISTGIHYPIPLHEQPAFSGYVDNPDPGNWIASKAANRVLSLPLFPELSDPDVHRIAEMLLDVIRED